MSKLARALGMEDAPPSGYRLAKIMATLMPSYAMAFAISTTFWLVFIAEELGHGDYVVGLAQAGVLVAIQLIVQTVLDYPTGTLGDRYGQRYVIASALCCYAGAFFLTSLVSSTSPYYLYVGIFALMGLGRSQESGAWGAWFDTNYRIAMPHDKDRKQYGVFQGKLGMLFGLATTLSLVPGGVLALIYGRAWVFQLQAVICVLLALVVLRLIKDLPEVIESRRVEDKKQDYVMLLKDGVRFVVSDKFIALFFTGQIIIFSMSVVYGQLILFPFYFTYLFTDVAVALYRTFLYIPQVPLQERSGIWAKRFDPKKWIPRFELLGIGGPGFFVILAAIMILCPPPTPPIEMATIFLPFTDFAILEYPVTATLALVLISILFIAGYLIGTISVILGQRVLLDVIPSRIRNSIYSLRPTLVMLVSLPLVIAFGEIIAEMGFPIAFILLSIISLSGVIVLRRAFVYYTGPPEEIESDEPKVQLPMAESSANTLDEGSPQEDDA
ncbi:MAG: MFS transporter, partial [Promethearchaeota archaeon]